MLKSLHFCALIFFLATAGCSTQSATTIPVKPVGLWHVVVFRLNHPEDVDARQQLIATCKTLFRTIPNIQELHVGIDLPGTRPHQDSDFAVAVIMGFESVKDLAAYQAHPEHIRAVVDVLKPLVRDYTSFDFTNEPNPPRIPEK